MYELGNLLSQAKKYHSNWNEKEIRSYMENTLNMNISTMMFDTCDNFLITLEDLIKKDLSGVYLQYGFIHPQKRKNTSITDLRYEFFQDNKNMTESDIDGSKILVSTSELINGSCQIINAIPPIRGVVGCPRSGMIPASIIATHLSVPLYGITDNKLVKMTGRSDNGGQRMVSFEERTELPLLLVDDTLHTGKAMSQAKEVIQKYNYKYITSSIFVYVGSKDKVDYYYKGLSHPHILEWNMFHGRITRFSMLDMDGVLCEDPPLKKIKSEKEYIEYLSQARPIKKNIPYMTPCYAICTARLEKYRGVTEDWLKENNVKYNNLIMYPHSREKRDNAFLEEASKYKADTFNNSNAKFFIESCKHQANRIKNLLSDKEKIVISITEKRIC